MANFLPTAITNALKGSKAAWNNLRGVHAGVYEEVEYPAFFLPDKVEWTDPNYKWSLDDPNLRRALLLQKTSLTRIPGSGRQGEEYINEAIARGIGNELQLGGPQSEILSGYGAYDPLNANQYDILTHIAMGSGNPLYRASLPIYGMIGDVDKYPERVQDLVTDAVTKEYKDRGITDKGTIFADPRLIKTAGEKSQLNIDWLQIKKQALADQPSLGEDDLQAISDQAAAQAFEEIKKGWGNVQPDIKPEFEPVDTSDQGSLGEWLRGSAPAQNRFGDWLRGTGFGQSMQPVVRAIDKVSRNLLPQPEQTPSGGFRNTETFRNLFSPKSEPDQTQVISPSSDYMQAGMFSGAVQDAIRESLKSGRLSRFFRSAEGSGIDLDKIKEDERAGEFGAKFYTPAHTSSGMGGDVDFGSNIAQALATGVIDRDIAQALGIRTTPFGQTTISQEGLPPGVPFPESVTDLPQEVQEPWETRDTWEAAINQILPESVTDLPPAGGLPPLPYLGDAEQFVEMGDLFGGTTMGVSPPVQETPASVLPSGFGGRELANMGGISLAEPGRWSTVETTPAEDKEQYMATQDALKAEQDRIAEETRQAEALAERKRKERTAQAKLDEKNRQEQIKSAEREALAERKRKERAEQAKENARTERARASAEQDRLEALSRQRDAERRAEEAKRTRQEAEAAEERKRQQQRDSAQKRKDDLLAKQMADMFKSMEEARNRALMNRLDRGAAPGQYLYDI